MRTLRSFIRTLFVLTLVAVVSSAIASPKEEAAIELKMNMRKLWEDHITYTRNYIISDLGGLEDKGAIATRLLRNQDDIGAAIKPFYGEEAGSKLTALLKDHITIATEVVTAAKAGNKEHLDASQAKWTQNGKDIAAFLSGANKHWAKADMEKML